MIATWVTRQLVFDGAVNGLTIGLIAIALVLVFRSTKVVNFAVGNMGTIGAALLALTALNYGAPFWLCVLAAVAAGTLFGAIVELVVVRRLFSGARVTLLVATIGVAQLATAIVEAFPDIRNPTRVRYPQAIGREFSVASIRITGAQLCVLVVVPAVAFVLSWFLNRTTFGKAVGASADNPRLARTLGINPKIVSTLVWSIGGFLSTVAMILVSAQSGRATGIAALGPNTMVRALAAAVIAGMVSFRLALLAGVAIGVVQSLVRFNFLDQTGLIDFLLFVAVVVAVWVRARQSGPDTATLRTPLVAIPQHLRTFWWVRHLNQMALGVLLLAGILLPLIVTTPSRQLLYSTVIAFALCACSLTVLTGWAGQLSLGQMAFAGIGAFTSAALTRGPLPFALAIPVAALLTAALAAAIGATALRVNGLLLAVSTFAFGIAAAQYLYQREVFSDGNSSSVPFRRGTLLGLDLSSQRTYYYVLLGALALVLVVLARLRDSGIGRSTIAVRDNADSAAAYTVGPFRTKLRAFALAGGIAGLGGGLLAGALQSVPMNDRFFQVDNSLQVVAISVIGGLGSLVGPVLGALWVVGLPAFFPDNELLPLFASSIGLLVLLLYVPGGLIQVVHLGRDAILRAAERRLRAPAPTPGGSAPGSTTPAVAAVAPGSGRTGDVVTSDDGVAARPEAPGPGGGRNGNGSTSVHAGPAQPGAPGAALVAEGVVVRFGGRVAVDRMSMHVAAGEIVGLIGTNGAGKSTMLNAIGGYVPAHGRVQLLGRDVSGLGAPGRARHGLGRTFQAARLFPELTVRETLLVALESQRRAGTVSSALALPPATRAERAKRARAEELIGLLGLGRYADRRIDRLSTGTRRIVELGGLLALGSTVLCLDEPTAGVAQRETEALAPLLVQLRAELDASMIVIEHDMPFITSICDRLYCMEAGRVIAEGTPDAIRRDPLVIASYLGTDQRAIERSAATTGV